MVLNYKEYGEGEAVIILHGLFGMLDNWHSFARQLGELFHVIVVDQRNHGQSFHSEAFDYNILASDLNEFMENKDIPCAHIIGHSLGGKTLLQFMNDFPMKVDKAVIIDIAPKAYSGGHEEIISAMLSLDLSNISTRSEAYNSMLDKISDPAIVNFLLKNLKRQNKHSFSWKANIHSLEKNYDHIKSGIYRKDPYYGKVLFVKGGKSTYITEEDEKRIKDTYVNSQVVNISGAGHWIHTEKPDELLEVLDGFLNS